MLRSFTSRTMRGGCGTPGAAWTGASSAPCARSRSPSRSSCGPAAVANPVRGAPLARGPSRVSSVVYRAVVRPGYLRRRWNEPRPAVPPAPRERLGRRLGRRGPRRLGQVLGGVGGGGAACLAADSLDRMQRGARRAPARHRPLPHPREAATTPTVARCLPTALRCGDAVDGRYDVRSSARVAITRPRIARQKDTLPTRGPAGWDGRVRLSAMAGC